MKKVCPICDSVNRSTAFFCHACGSRLLTTIPPAVALAGEQDSSSLPPSPSEPAETTAEIEQIEGAQKAQEVQKIDDEKAQEAQETQEIDDEKAQEAQETDDEEIPEIYHKAQENQEAQKAESNEEAVLAEGLEAKVEADQSDISTGELTPEVTAEAAALAISSDEVAAPAISNDEAAAPAISSDEVKPLSAESEAQAQEVEQEESAPDLPLSVASEEEQASEQEQASEEQEQASEEELASEEEEQTSEEEEQTSEEEEQTSEEEEQTSEEDHASDEITSTEEPTTPLAHEAKSVTKAVVRKEIDTDELVITPSVVSFKKKTTGSSQERQSTTVLALPPRLEAKEEAALEITVPSTLPNEGQLSALPAGTLVAERFETIALLESDGQTNLYSVYDRVACPSCGSAENQPNDNYCWECGFDFSRRHEFVKSELREALADDELDGYEGERFVDHQRFYLRQEEDTTLAAPPSTEPVQSPPEPQSITLSVGYQSDTGMVRQLNEDSLSVFVLTGLYESLSKPALGLFIVADGMGGHAGGEIASKFVVQTITDRLVRRVLLDHFNTDQSPREEAIKPRVEEAVRYANEQLYRLAQERYSDMGSTVTLALVVDHRAYIANVGDSRVYIRRNGQLQQISKDHSVVASLIAAGMAQPHEIYTHPERNVVYRSMGNRPTVEIDMWEEELKSGDQLLLCSDGLWEAIYNEGIEEVLLTVSDPQAATEEMVRRANLAGGEDNITVILAEVR